ncbi:hypothetical protein [Thaumasiovibrio subtropicus]|uniref:hypothetical protein n=1 Tax=Thaumasiovibrio subtropicus TaxID=1891207 RepID=UPI000B35A585|nr:hypothetical protein [Thaumasiovibrio subtropicus]
MKKAVGVLTAVVMMSIAGYLYHDYQARTYALIARCDGSIDGNIHMRIASAKEEGVKEMIFGTQALCDAGSLELTLSDVDFVLVELILDEQNVYSARWELGDGIETDRETGYFSLFRLSPHAPYLVHESI